MLYEKRDKLDKHGERLGRLFSKFPLSPNQWTIAAIIFAAGAAFFLTRNSFFVAAVMFAIASIMDVIDGAVARHRKQATPKGGYLDTITDRYVEFIVIAGLFFASLPSVFADARLWLILYLFGSMTTTYAKASAMEYLKKQVKGGVLERGERLILLFAGILLATFSAVYLTYVIIILAVLSNITALQRINKAMRSE